MINLIEFYDQTVHIFSYPVCHVEISKFIKINIRKIHKPPLQVVVYSVLKRQHCKREG